MRDLFLAPCNTTNLNKEMVARERYATAVISGQSCVA